MSKTIDEKVVEMRFDNKHFEANVKTTLSTLDKLKAKLHLTGASKGLEEVNKASKKVDFSHMENSLAALEKRFSTTGIVGMTVIQNLTNAGLRFAKTLSNFSIGGILEGGKARATKIENAQFQIKGLLKDMDNADQKLKDIMSDVNYGVESTAYGLDAAATVAAQLVASGMEAGDGMRSALRGISGVAAMTNSTYEDIGRIYTKVAGNGRLMGEELLQLSSRGMNAAAVLAKSLNKTEAEVRDMVSKGKISFEMFSKAMDDAFGEHAKDANKTLNGVLSNIKAALAKIGADFYGPIIAENSPLVLFLNSVRERINDIRKTLAPITKEITDRINNMFTKIDTWFKNTKNVLGFSPFEKFKDVLKTIQGPIEKVNNAIQTVTKTMKDYENVVDEIIRGNFKNAPERFQLLAEAGYDWAYAQNLVNERLGSSFRYATDYTPAVEGATTATGEMTDKTKDLVSQLSKLSDEELRSKGYTEEQIEALRTLGDVAKKTGLSIDKLLELMNADAFNTRFLIFNSFKNIGLTIVSILKSIGKAFGEVFAIKPDGLFDIIAAFHKFTQLIRDRVEKNADKLTRTFKGLFSIIHIITSVVGGAFKFALKIINGILESFGLTLLDVTAAIGDAIFAFDRWITSNNTFVQIGKAVIEVIVAIVKWIGQVVTAIKDWAMQNEAIMTFINNIRNGFSNLGSSIESWIKGLKETDNVPKYIFEGLVNGLKKGAGKVYEAITTIGQGIIQAICNVLGIHSPSKVMYAIGGFLILGLIGGMQAQSISLWDMIKGIGSKIIDFFKQLDLGNKIIDFFKQLDFGNIIAIGITAGILVLTKKIVGIVDKLMSPVVGLGNLLTGLGDALTGLGDAATNFGKSMKYQGIAAIIKSIAISIGVLVAAVWILGNMNQEQLIQGGIALGVLAGGLVIFIGILAALSKPLSNLKLPDMGKLLAMTIGLSVGMLIISKALKNVAAIDSDKMGWAIGGLITCAVAMGILIVALSKLTKSINGIDDKSIKQLSKIFTRIATSMLLISIALRLMSKVQSEDIWKMVGVMAAMSVFLIAIAAINKFSENSITKSADTIKAVGIALLLLVISMKLCGSLESKHFKNGIKVVGVFLLLLLGMMAISKKFNGVEMVKVTASILMAVVAIGLLAIIAKLTSNIDPKQMQKGLACVAVLGLIVAGLIVVSRNSKSFHGLTLVGVGIAIVAMGVMAFLLGQIELDKLAKGITAVAILSVFVSGLIAAAKNFSPGENAVKTLVTMIVMLVLLVAAVVGLSFIDSERLYAATSALSAVMLSLAATIAATSKLKTDKGVISTLITLTVVIALLATILVAMSLLVGDTNSLIASATSLSLLILALAATMKILSTIKMPDKRNVSKIIKALYELAGIVAILGLVIGAMSYFVSDPTSLIASAISISLVLTVMIGILYALTGLSSINESKIKKSILSLGLLTLVVAGIAAIIGLLSNFGGDANSIMTIAIALSTFLGAMTIVLAGLAAIGTYLGAGVFTGIGALATLIGVIGGILAALGALVTYVPQVKDFIDNGLPILEKIGYALGSFIGNIVGGLLTGITNALPNVAENLSSFMDKMSGFIDGCKNVDDSVLKGVGILALAILELSGAEIIHGIASLFGGFGGLAMLGLELSAFARNTGDFIEIIGGIDPSVGSGIKSLCGAILELSSANLLNAIAKLFGSDNSLATFAKDFPTLGEKLKGFSDSLGTFGSDQVTSINCAGEAIKALAQAAKDIPGEGGFWEKIVGKKDLGQFTSQLPTVADGILSFSNSLMANGGFGDDQIKTVECGATAISKLAQAAKDIPGEGGFWQKIAGEQNLGEFAGRLPTVAKGIVSFVTELTKNGPFGDDQIKTAECGANVISKLAQAAKEIPAEGGWWQKIAGEQNIENFAGRLGKVAEGIRGFVWELQKDNVITKDSIDKIDAVNNIMWAIADLGKIGAIQNIGGQLEEFGARLGSFGNKVTEYVKGINTVSIDDLEKAKEKILKLFDIADLSNHNDNAKKLEEFGNNLTKFGTETVTKLADTLKNLESKAKVISSINELLDTMIKAINEKKKDSDTAIKSVIDSVIEVFKTSDKSAAEEAGKNFVQGFANGITNNLYLARDAGSSVGKRALEAAKASIDSHSPSRETYKLGAFFDQGFINGVRSLQDKIYDETYGVGEKARLGLGRAIRGVSNLISEGIDDEITIRPVLDLSNVRSGAAAINGMLGVPSIGVMSNLNAISTGMRTYRQNGGDEVVSAIDKLGKSLGNTTGDTYNINGVSYSDNAEISEAVKTLVRAARIERRT